MITINLYPWREYHRSRLRRQFCISVIAIVIATCIIIFTLMDLYLKKSQRLSEINHIYQQRVLKLKNDLKLQQNVMQLRENILSRLDIFKKVDNHEVVLLQYISGMTQVLPDDSYYTRTSFSDNKFQLEGRVRSKIQLSSLLENIKAKNWSVLLENSQITDNGDQDIFSISFRIQIMMN